MGTAFLITLREGLEAALIIAIVMAYLRTLGRKDQFKFVLFGAIAAVIISLVIASLVFIYLGKLEGATEQFTEGFVSLLAAGVLTWMIFWMRGQSKTIGKDLRGRVDSALTKGSIIAMASVVFIGVLREGTETGLFLIAVFLQNTAVDSMLGAVAGLITAGIIGYLIYAGSKIINLKLFFQVTGGFIILVAAGMLSNAIHEFQELGVISIYLRPAWDLSSVPIIGSGAVAYILKSVIGWRPDPSIGQAFVWSSYLILASLFFYFSGFLPKSTKRSEN